MRREDVKIGARVKCIYNHYMDRFGKTGTIYKLDYYNGPHNGPLIIKDITGFFIRWDDGFCHDYTGWGNPDSFELMNDNEIVSSSSPSNYRNEKPCKVCRRMNDMGVSKCWNCEIDFPGGDLK